MNPVTYQGLLKKLVDDYDRLDENLKAPGFWNDNSLNNVRAFIKAHYRQEQDYECCYCRVRIATDHDGVWDVEHIACRTRYPRFMFTPVNLALACKDCNIAKGDQGVFIRTPGIKYPLRADRFKIVHPHFDVYEEHIVKGRAGVYVPRTAKGEKTIYMCHLLRYAYRFAGFDEILLEVAPLTETISDLWDDVQGLQDRIPQCISDLLLE